MSKYETMHRPPVRVRRETYLKLKEIQDASGESIADIMERAVQSIYSTGGGMLTGFKDEYEKVKDK